MGALTKFKRSTAVSMAVPMLLSASSLALVSTMAHGQVMLEEVIVTAQKREQDAMTVPITVDTFSAQDMETVGALDIKDVANYIPGFETGDGITQVGLTIRGVSSSNISSGGDPSVSTFYDDVYLPQAASTVAFADMARIEVLKGPQGTLFGRNAAAGVVNMVPNQPSADFEGFATVKAGNYDLMRFEGMINAPLTDDLFLRANIFTNQRDGYVDNVGTGPDVGDQDNQAARIALLWNMTEATNLQVSYDYDKVDNAPRGSIAVGRYAYNNDPLSGKVDNDVINGEETRDMYAVTAKLNHEFNDTMSMKLITSYRDWDTTNREDEDGSGEITAYIDVNTSYDSDIFYNELQFHFVNDRVDWITGASYSQESVKQELTMTLFADSVARFVTRGGLNAAINDEYSAEIAAGLVPEADYDYYWDPAEFADALSTYPGIPVTEQDVIDTGDFWYEAASSLFGNNLIMGPSLGGNQWQERIDNEGDLYNWGIYSDVDITITDSFNLIVGLRYSRDKKDYSWFTPTNTFDALRPGVPNLIFGAAPGEVVNQKVEATEEWGQTTGRVVANYQFTDEAMTFLSVSTGYKAGGFDSLSQLSATDPFDPEDVLNYEWGIKGTFMDNRLRTQLSVYRMEVDDRQRSVDTMPPGQGAAFPQIINGDQTMEGVELTLDWIALDSLKLGAVTTFRDEESEWELYYDSFGDEQTEKESNSANLEYTLTLDWTPDIPVGEMLFHIDYVFQEQNLDDDPNYRPEYDSIENFNDDIELVNARLAWFSEDGQYEVAVWGLNLLDNQYTGLPGGLASSPDTLGATFVTVTPPLTYGADFKYSF